MTLDLIAKKSKIQKEDRPEKDLFLADSSRRFCALTALVTNLRQPKQYNCRERFTMSDCETTGSSSIWISPEVRKSFLAIRRALYRRRYSQVDYLSKKYQKRFPAYSGYFLDMEANAHFLRGHKDIGLELLIRANDFFQGQVLPTLQTLIKRLREHGRLDEAETYMEQALRDFPKDWSLQQSRCETLFEQGRIQEAIEATRKLCAVNPTVDVLTLLGRYCFELGQYEECSKAFARCQTMSGDADVWHHWVYYAHFIPGFSEAELTALCKDWCDAGWSSFPVTPSALLERKRQPQKSLRIGLLSPGMYTHPVGSMTAHAIYLLSRLPDIEIYCYSLQPCFSAGDEPYRLFRNAAHKWVNAHEWNVERVYKKMLSDKLDIAIDMAGHLESSMLAIFAHRVAPVQIKWVGGQFSTTGLSSMDYLLTDRFETPNHCDELYTEKLVRLPNSYISYQLKDFGDTERLDETPDHPIVFGCFNTHYKLNPELAGVWAEILNRVPNSILFIKAYKFDQPEVLEATRKLFTDCGIAPERLRLEGSSLHEELLQKYREVDIALDPWPFSGGLTTLEALWMGVPVVTTPGPSFAGRHSYSHLSNLGLDSLIGETFEDYIEIAVRLANDRNLLQELRILLPYTMTTSPLTDHTQMAADLYTAFRAMWTRYCEGLPPVAMRFEQSSEIPKEFEISSLKGKTDAS